jgi:RimJ/RimL family protein N-acetyltransferase
MGGPPSTMPARVHAKPDVHEEVAVRLRDVELGDLDVYVRMRCDPAMMAELGGPLPRDGIEAKVRHDVAAVASGSAWILMILPDEADPDTVAGSVVVWSSNEHGQSFSEIGWMVLPRFQGRGVARAAVRAVLERAREEDRWGLLQAVPGLTNSPSNGICRTLGFSLIGQQDVVFSGRLLQTNHWRLDPRADLRGAT